MCSHSAPCFSGGGEAQGGDGDREADLTRTIAALRKDVADAQKQAAQEAGHVAQYRSLAEGAEENTRIVQACMSFCTCSSGATARRMCAGVPHANQLFPSLMYVTKPILLHMLQQSINGVR